MALNPPDTSDTRSRLADWLELLALTSRHRRAKRTDLLGLYELLEDDVHGTARDDGTPLDEEILEERQYFFADAVLEEIEHRSRVLGGHYPYRITATGQDWYIVPVDANFDDPTSVGQMCYVFCLFVSAIRDRRIAGASLVSLEKDMPNYFQAIATDVAASLLGGSSFSFGWPRPEGSDFMTAVDNLTKSLKMGVALSEPPLFASGKEKDAGIDVVAWRDFPDRRPGKVVLFGQVASGKNWKGKSVVGDIAPFSSWFAQPLSQHYIPAMFIPFPQHHELAEPSDASFEDVASADAWYMERKFGLVVDRLRIVGAPPRQPTPVYESIRDWITDVLEVSRTE